jgi:tetratricopeptide (TPR) repeat protein
VEVNDMPLYIRALIAILVCLFMPFAAARAYADPLSKPASAAAREHLVLGNRLYGVRSFDDAAAEYKAGALIEPAPVFDYNLGQCFRQLGKYQEAIWHYERFATRANPQGELLDAVNGFIAQMKSELDKKAMTQKPTEAAPPQVNESPPARLRAEQQVTPPTDAWYKDHVGWGLTAVGVVGVAVGAGFLIDAVSLRNQANANPSQQGSNRQHEIVGSRSVLGGGLGIGGVVFLVSGVIKLAIHADSSPSVAEWSLAVSGDGVLVSGSF